LETALKDVSASPVKRLKESIAQADFIFATSAVCGLQEERVDGLGKHVKSVWKLIKIERKITKYFYLSVAIV
jgi:hypothetical protein